MSITYARAASTVLLTATLVSAAYQVYRALLAEAPQVDRFGLDGAVAYAVLAALSLALLTDRRIVWLLTASIMLLQLVYAVVGYYPMIQAARPMVLLDWIEGTFYTGALVAVLALATLRLTGVALRAERAPREALIEVAR